MKVSAQERPEEPKHDGNSHNNSPGGSKIATILSPKTTVATSDNSSLEDSSDGQARQQQQPQEQQQQQQQQQIQALGKTLERQHFVVTQNRCSNPDPEANGVSSPIDNVLVPKVIRVSAVRPRIIRPIPSKVVVMAAEPQGGMGAGVDDAQIDFPVSTTHNSALGATMARPQHAQIPYQTNAAPVGTTGNGFSRVPLSRKSPAGSQASASSASVHPTPLFQRLVTEEVQEIKIYTRRIEQQNRRLGELERVHRDLEERLEMEADRRQELEQTLQERERDWAQQISDLQSDRDHWKDLVQMERNKNSRLMDQVARKDQDIHRMLQRKYDLQDRDTNLNHSIPTSTTPPPINRGKSPELNIPRKLLSPHAILAESGSAEAVRQRNVVNTMLDFFGMQ